MKTKNTKLVFSSYIVVPFLLVLIHMFLPLTLQANIQGESREKGPLTDGHVVYFPIPSDISREAFLSPSQHLRDRLHGLVKRYLVASQDQGLEGATDLVVVFTDHDGQPILPDLDALRQKKNAFGSTLDLSETKNKLTFTFNSPDYPWNAEELSTLQTMLNNFYQTAEIVYGYPAFNITVNVRQDPTISSAGVYYSSSNEFAVKSLQSDVICHEMIHAFRDDFVISLNSYEEGMTRAAEIEVFDRLTAYQHSWDASHSYSYDVYYDGLNSPVIGGQSGSFRRMSPNTLELLRYQLAGYAWAKPLLENSNFFVDFNREYYAETVSDSATRYSESKLLDILLKVQPTVEGKPFLTWYEEQGILNTNPPKGYFLHHRPIYKIDFFYRDNSGKETMQADATIEWAVYDFQDELLDNGSAVTSSYGVTSFLPLLPVDYEGRIKVEATASTSEGVITHTYHTLASGSQLKMEGIFGATPYSDSGTVTITWLDDPGSSATVDLVNGAFCVPSFVDMRGRFIADFQGASGETFSKQFNKDASSYFLLMIPPHNLTTTKTGTGSGNIIGKSINCGTDCEEKYNNGTQVILTSSADAGSTFSGWSGCDLTTENQCIVYMTSDKSVSAAFTLNQHTLNVGTSGTGSGIVSATGITCGADCTETYSYGTQIDLTASPDAGSTFTSWFGCDNPSGNTCTLNMTSNKSVTAVFTLNQHTLTVEKKGTGTGTVTGIGISCGDDCIELYNYGAAVALTPTASPSSTFSHWTDCDSVSGTVCTMTMTSTKSVSAWFTIKQHTLNATKTGTGSGTLTASGLSCGETTCTGTYNYGDTVQITATPGNGAVFGEWTGCDSIANNVCTVVINENKNVTASFFLEFTLAVTLEGTGDGKVTSTPSGIDCEPACSKTFIMGTPIQLTARPYGGSVFAYWSGACSGTTDTCDLVMSDYLGVTAHFTSENTKEYTLKVKKTKKNKGDGVVTSKDGNIDCGDACSYKYYNDTVITLSATANEGSTFIGWKPTNLNCAGISPCTVTIDKAKTVQAVFVGDYALKIVNKGKKGGTGIVTSTPIGINCATGNTTGCIALYGYGEMVTLSASADADSLFVGWSPAKLCPGIADCVVPMDKKRTIKAIFSGP